MLKKRRGLTPTELVLVLFVVAALVVVLFPVMSRGRGRRSPCRENMHWLSAGLQMYLSDYDERFPPAAYLQGATSVTLPAILQAYANDGAVWRCPSSRPGETAGQQFDGRLDDATVSYGYNWAALAPEGAGIDAHRIRSPGKVAILVESSLYRATPAALVPALGGAPPGYRHSQRAGVAYADGRVRYQPVATLEASVTGKSGIDAFDEWRVK